MNNDKDTKPDNPPFAFEDWHLNEYLNSFKRKHSLEECKDYIEKVKSLKVLVVGETIIDEYCYCETIGKSGKEPILAARYISSEKFAGGILAIANHIAGFCDEVGVLTFLGEVNSYRELIEAKLNQAVKRYFLTVPGEPTIIKRRYVERYPLQKLFEVYEMNNVSESEACEKELCRSLDKLLPLYDLVIIADYGHGMLDNQTVDLICRKAPYLAVNTQVNADNRGFNTISKYKRADYICISENEIRLEARSRSKPLEPIIEEISNKMHCPNILITQGSSGCLVFQKDKGFYKSPALTQHYVDRIGAGDAVLGITSLFSFVDVSPETHGLMGNIIGAIAVGIMGNKEPVTNESLLRWLNMIYF